MIKNISMAREVIAKLMYDGFVPYSPVHHFGWMYGSVSEDFMLPIFATMIDACDCLLALGNTGGIRSEIGVAHTLNKPVFETMLDLKRYAKAQLEIRSQLHAASKAVQRVW